MKITTDTDYIEQNLVGLESLSDNERYWAVYYAMSMMSILKTLDTKLNSGMVVESMEYKKGISRRESIVMILQVPDGEGNMLRIKIIHQYNTEDSVTVTRAQWSYATGKRMNLELEKASSFHYMMNDIVEDLGKNKILKHTSDWYDAREEFVAKCFRSKSELYPFIIEALKRNGLTAQGNGYTPDVRTNLGIAKSIEEFYMIVLYESEEPCKGIEVTIEYRNNSDVVVIGVRGTGGACIGTVTASTVYKCDETIAVEALTSLIGKLKSSKEHPVQPEQPVQRPQPAQPAQPVQRPQPPQRPQQQPQFGTNEMRVAEESANKPKNMIRTFKGCNCCGSETNQLIYGSIMYGNICNKCLQKYFCKVGDKIALKRVPQLLGMKTQIEFSEIYSESMCKALMDIYGRYQAMIIGVKQVGNRGIQIDMAVKHRGKTMMLTLLGTTYQLCRFDERCKDPSKIVGVAIYQIVNPENSHVNIKRLVYEKPRGVQYNLEKQRTYIINMKETEDRPIGTM